MPLPQDFAWFYQPTIYQGASLQFCVATWSDDDPPLHLDARRMNGDRPLISLNPSADGVSYASVLHRSSPGFGCNIAAMGAALALSEKITAAVGSIWPEVTRCSEGRSPQRHWSLSANIEPNSRIPDIAGIAISHPQVAVRLPCLRALSG
jgi:hypothetical protein